MIFLSCRRSRSCPRCLRSLWTRLRSVPLPDVCHHQKKLSTPLQSTILPLMFLFLPQGQMGSTFLVDLWEVSLCLYEDRKRTLHFRCKEREFRLTWLETPNRETRVSSESRHFEKVCKVYFLEIISVFVVILNIEPWTPLGHLSLEPLWIEHWYWDKLSLIVIQNKNLINIVAIATVPWLTITFSGGIIWLSHNHVQ